MHLNKLALNIFAFVTSVSTAFGFNFQTSFVLGQSAEARKSEAERLWKLCRENFKQNQFQAVLSNLPSSEQEAEKIATLLKTQALTGNKATKAAIIQRMQLASIIHLATHGILDNIRGLGSALAFTPSGNDNGLLTADEILNLPLTATDMVVLSACNTGRGRITGDGVIGLSRSFISAGVPSVVVSLWAVPDDATAFLMTEFYQNYLEKKLDKATALQKAMQTTKLKYPNPRQWAAFTLIGEAG